MVQRDVLSVSRVFDVLGIFLNIIWKPGGGGNANATNPNRSWDSQGPENIKVRGNAQTVYERYMQLARDAAAGGDRVLAENYTQHAEHYFRVLRALQPARPVSEIAQRELAGQGFDIDFEDESGAQAAAILAAQQAEADRAAEQERRQREQEERQQERQNNNGEGRRDREDREPRAEGEDGQGREGGRRESRRERWERRREERNRRFETEAGGEAPADAGDSAAPAGDMTADAAPERPERAPRRPRREEASEDAAALPGFLTRSSAPAAPAAEEAEAAPAPKRPRAPRKPKVEAPADEG